MGLFSRVLLDESEDATSPEAIKKWRIAHVIWFVATYIAILTIGTLVYGLYVLIK